MRFHVEQIVEAPLEAAFAVISDASLRIRWQSSLRRVEVLTPHSVGVGARWREATKLGPTFEMEITRHEPYSVWAERGRGSVADARLTVFFDKQSESQTRISVEVDVAFKGAAALLAPIVRLLMPPALEADLLRAGKLATDATIVDGLPPRT